MQKGFILTFSSFLNTSSNKMNYKNSEQIGSTLLELMIAISLGLILIGSGTLAISTLLTSKPVQQVAKEITAFLEQASVCAVHSQKAVSIKLEGNLLRESFKQETIDLPKNYDYTIRFGGIENAITYYPSGFASAGTIAIQSAENLCIISQTISGARKTQCSNA